MPIQTFRYAVCGGGNTLLDIFLYFFSYNFLLNKHLVEGTEGPFYVVFTPYGVISAHIAALFMAFCVSFPTGYLLNRFIVFSGSILKGRIQLFRYFLLVIVCLLLNYVFIKLFVEYFMIYPTIAKIITTVIVVSFSYLTQKNFTFKSGH